MAGKLRMTIWAGGVLAAALLTRDGHGQNSYTFQVNGGVGTVTLDDGAEQEVSSINGTSFTFQMLPSGIGQFLFDDDLTFQSTDSVHGVGDAPISIYGLNNITMESGVTVDVSATDSVPGPGGGHGAASGGAGGASGDGGDGGALSTPSEPLWSNGASGASGGAANPVFGGCSTTAGFNAGTGYNALAGGNGVNGVNGQFGVAGTAGFHNPTGPGAGGVRGLGGSRGTRGLGAAAGGSGGSGGAAGGTFSAGGHGGDGNSGSPGGGGNHGQSPTVPASDGGGGQNLATGLMISGGAGGGSGGGGGGGGGAGGGGAGSGGGGGGGGGGAVGFASCLPGGRGGNGGEGGAGGGGGDGGEGGSGGVGGHGGGALEIVARGSLYARQNSLWANGSSGQSGFSGVNGINPGNNGSAGVDGGNGATGSTDVNYSGDGGDGGDGGRGGHGGHGATGGAGGNGGGGGGGTVKLTGSVVVGDDITVDASGGGNGGQGRFVLANNANNSFSGVVTGAPLEAFPGTVGHNPYIKGGENTPLLPGLERIVGFSGGAESYGVLNPSVVNSQNSAFDDVRNLAPGNAKAAVLRLDSSPALIDLDSDGTHDAVDFAQHDMLVFMSVDLAGLDNPMLGVDPAGSDAEFLVNLMVQGFELDPAFGGAGPLTVNQLEGIEVFATLIPETASFINAAVDGATLRGGNLAAGEWAYLLTAAACDFDGNGSCDTDDMRMLYDNIADGTSGGPADLDGSGVVDNDDLDDWLTLAGTQNGKTYVPGDTDLDGDVVGADFTQLAAGFGQSGLPGAYWDQGNFDGNAGGTFHVSGSDFTNLAANFGTASVNTVPEPEGIVMWLLCAGFIASAVRRRPTRHGRSL